MNTQANHIRHGFSAVRPYLYGPMELLPFLRETLGATELERHEFSPGSVHVEMQIGDSILLIEAGKLPSGVPAWTNALYVYVPDVDAVFARAMQHGAAPMSEPEDKPYNERQCGFHDMAGNAWWVATYRGE